MKKYLLLLCFCICYSTNAQVYDSLATNSVKIDLLNLTDNFPSLLLSFEHRLSKRVYLNHEAGVVLPVTNYRGDNVSGFKLREELRRYVISWGASDFYMGLDVRYTQERIKENIVLGFGCVDSWGNCQYFRNDVGTFKKELWAFDYRLGLRHSIYPFYFEYDMGFGYGKDYISKPDINLEPGFVIISEAPYNILFEGWKMLFSLRAKLGFYISKKPNQKN